MTLTATGGGFMFSLDSVSGTWKWTVAASSLNGPGQFYQVQDIVTPYGPLNVAAIPLPSDVVEAMAQSISDIRNQVKPRMTLVSTQTSFSVGVTEGDPRRSVGSVQVRNDGGFGSYMSVSATADVSWLTVLTPSTVGLARGDIATFSFDLVPNLLLAAQSPYTGHIVVRDANDSSTAVTVTVSVVVIPRPAISVSTQSVFLDWSVVNQMPVRQTVLVSNGGPGTSSLEVSAQKLSGVSWLNVSPAFLGPLVSGQTGTIVLSVVASAVPFGVSQQYVETVRLSSLNASNSPVDVQVILSVGP